MFFDDTAFTVLMDRTGYIICDLYKAVDYKPRHRFFTATRKPLKWHKYAAALFTYGYDWERSRSFINLLAADVV